MTLTILSSLKRSKKKSPLRRPQTVLATGLLAAILEPDRTLARQRWPWDAGRDLRS